MAHVISTINLKGGVGKTTTTVALAETLSSEFHKRVLVIDLDPQTNATAMLIGESKWRDLNDVGHTLAQMFKDALDPGNKQFDFNKVLQKDVSDVSTTHTIDLLPSSLDLIDVQDQLALASIGKFYSVNPTEILHRAVKSKLDNYDIVIVDCPPNLGIITLNGLRISKGYIIPTIPDFLSTYGIPQIIKRVNGFSDTIGEEIKPLGIVVTKYQSNSVVHKSGLQRLQEKKDAPLFATKIKQANNIASAAEYFKRTRTLIQKYGSEFADSYRSLAQEMVLKLEG